jgi:hypothetical protein
MTQKEYVSYYCENERPPRAVICQKRKGHKGKHRAVIFWEAEKRLMDKLEVGNTVIIYEDPMTESKPEGKAKLVELLKDGIDLQYWRVESLGEQFNRWIKKHD